MRTNNRKLTDIQGYKGFKNMTMNEEVFSFRKKCMSHIYKAKELVESLGKSMPRIELRVIENNSSTLWGCACKRADKHVVWINVKTVKHTTDTFLERVMLHEILHTLGVGHDNTCPLMCPYTNHSILEQMSITDQQKKQRELFLNYIKRVL